MIKRKLRVAASSAQGQRTCARESYLLSSGDEVWTIGTVGACSVLMPERFPFDVDGERIVATAYTATEPLGLTLLLGPGSSGEQDHPSIVEHATELARRGVLVVTYDFCFASRGRTRPDANDQLENCCRSAIGAARECRPRNRLFAGGKSLAARVSAQVIGQGGPEVDDVLGLVALGYSLHPVGRRGASHVQVLASLDVPAVFLQGTRDPFGTPEELRRVVGRMPGGTEVIAIEDGDHSLTVPSHGSPLQAQVNASLQDAIVRWMQQVSERFEGTPRRPTHQRIAGRMRERLRELRRRAT